MAQRHSPRLFAERWWWWARGEERWLGGSGGGVGVGGRKGGGGSGGGEWEVEVGVEEEGGREGGRGWGGRGERGGEGCSGWVGGGGEESCGIGIGFGARVILRAQGLHAPEHSFHSASDSHATAILCALKMSTFTSRLTPVDRTTPDCVRATFKWSAQACFHDRDIRSQVQEECKGPKKSQEGGNTQKSFPSSPVV